MQQSLKNYSRPSEQSFPLQVSFVFPLLFITSLVAAAEVAAAEVEGLMASADTNPA